MKNNLNLIINILCLLHVEMTFRHIGLNKTLKFKKWNKIFNIHYLGIIINGRI